MTSPARRHYQRITAALAAADAGTAPMQGDHYQLMMASIFEDYRRLKSTQSMERKAEVKREILPKYDAYVTGVLETGKGAQDDVLMRVMLWRIDAGDLEGGLDIAEYAIRHGLNPPDNFERKTAPLVTEEIADQILRELTKDDVEAQPLLNTLNRIEALTCEADMHDQIRAKVHKALGYAQRGTGQLDEALANLKRALELNDRIGVKKDIEKLERELKNAAPAQPEATQNDTEQPVTTPEQD